MIRRVAFRKAVVAGAAGALAWELLVLLLTWWGAPVGDVSRSLGHLVAPDASPAAQWMAGLAIHLTIGAIWAVFYAYFFWSTLDLAPAFQGAIFSILPAMLAGLIVVPQFALMDPQSSHPGLFGINHGWIGPAGIFVNHFIYGFVMGSIYVRPVGSPVSKELRRA